MLSPRDDTDDTIAAYVELASGFGDFFQLFPIAYPDQGRAVELDISSGAETRERATHRFRG